MLSGPVEKSGAAVSIACLVGYAPSMFAFILYGSMLGRSSANKGFIISSLVKIANKKKETNKIFKKNLMLN